MDNQVRLLHPEHEGAHSLSPWTLAFLAALRIAEKYGFEQTAEQSKSPRGNAGESELDNNTSREGNPDDGEVEK
jgi:hypothetical protein